MQTFMPHLHYTASMRTTVHQNIIGAPNFGTIKLFNFLSLRIFYYFSLLPLKIRKRAHYRYCYCDNWDSDNFTGSYEQLYKAIQKLIKDFKSDNVCYKKVRRAITIQRAIEEGS